VSRQSMTSLVVSNTTPLQNIEKKQNKTAVPEYPHRTEHRFIPRCDEDFEDGGAYPEIHVFQYPANMGLKHKYRSSASHRTLVPTVDAKGEVDYDAVVKQGENKNKVVHTGYESLREKPRVEAQIQKPDEEQIAETTERTQQALEKIVQAKINASKPKSFEGERNDGKPTFIRYTPANADDGHNSGAKQRIIKLVEAPVDPLEPPRFQHKKTPAAPPSPPVPILHSPPRKLDPEEAANWKIPPCISNWKNNKGYTIPLDKRVAADGRGLQDVRINDKFAKFTESLYIAERNAREEVEKRAQLQKKLAEKEKERREMELRELATRARNERAGKYTEEAPRDTSTRSSLPMEGGSERDFSNTSPALSNSVGQEDLEEKDYDKMSKEEQREYRKRQQIREERRRERQRQLRLWEKEEELGRSGKRSKLARDQDRDISERIALNQPIVNNVRGEVQYDQRLFNQSSGLDRGFGAEDSYNIYDKPLFSGGSGASLIRPSRTAVDSSQAEDMDKNSSSNRQFRPDVGFHSVESQDNNASRKERTKPVEFEHDEVTSIRASGKMASQEADDPLGLEAFLTEAKRAGSKRDSNFSSRGNVMSFVGSSDPSGLQEEYKARGGSHRSKIHFQPAKDEES